MSLSSSTLLGRSKLFDLSNVLLPLVVLPFAATPDTVLLSSFAFGLLLPLLPAFALPNSVSGVLLGESFGEMTSLV